MCHVALESWQWIHQVAAPCMQCDTWLLDNMPLNLPGGSTLQCDMYLPMGPWHWIRQVAASSILQCGRWLWDDMPWNSPKRPPYWNSTSGFDLDHITAVDMSFCTSLKNFIQTGPRYVMSIFKMGRISAILDFRDQWVLWKAHVRLPVGRQDHSSKLLSFWENRVFLHFGDRQTDKQTDR